jgi:general secretion pathway protein K
VKAHPAFPNNPSSVGRASARHVGLKPDLHKQRGVAVIMALLLTTLAITIVASLFWQQQVQVRSIENQRLQLQKQWILRGALDWAGLILREDAKYSSVDTLDEPWAVPLAETRLDQYVENGRDDADTADATLSGSISDAQARYNLTNLCTNGTINPIEVAAFEQMLNNAHLDPALAQATADEMAAAQKKPEVVVAKSGSQLVPQPMNLTQVDDLLAVPGFTPEILDKLKNFVIFLPRATPINVNTAPAEVLAARIDGLSLSEAALLVEYRNNIASFSDLAHFAQQLPGASLGAPASQASVTTNYFLVNGKVHMSRAGLEVQALIERYGIGNAANTKLIWIREY